MKLPSFLKPKPDPAILARLEAANMQLAQALRQASDINDALRSLTREITPIVVAHLADDTKGVLREVNAFVERRVRVCSAAPQVLQ